MQGIWLPDHYGRKNCSCQELPGGARSCLRLPGAARNCLGLTRPARIEHELPVALVRLAKGRCSLVRRGEVGKVRPMSLKPWEGRSVIAVAQECADLLKGGQSEAGAAAQMRLSRCKMRNLIALLGLPNTIKDHLLRTRDLGGGIGERQLRALLRIQEERAQVVEFRRMVLATA